MHSSWKEALKSELNQDYMKSLKAFLKQRGQKKGVHVFPASSKTFAAFENSFDDVQVVILGQDPYHGPGQAHGLSFSVPKGVLPPPSLKNIFKELNRSLNLPIPNHGSLESWADQGVLLLNSVLSVEKGKPGSHAGKGWEIFTDAVIETLSEKRKNLVFLLWGSYAWKKGVHIDSKKHLILKTSHPSPLSAYRGFLGSNHFSMTNNFLKKQGKKEICWDLK